MNQFIKILSLSKIAAQVQGFAGSPNGLFLYRRSRWLNQIFFDQYKHPKWQKRRAEYFYRQEEIYSREGIETPFCEWCLSDEKQLQLHHLIYHNNRKIWEYDDDELVLLCSDCHKEMHNLSGDIKTHIKHALNHPENIELLEPVLRIFSVLKPYQSEHALDAIIKRMRELNISIPI